VPFQRSRNSASSGRLLNRRPFSALDLRGDLLTIAKQAATHSQPLRNGGWVEASAVPA